MSELLDAALTYAARGWPVFPCHSIHNGKCSCGNPDCAPAGKHPLTADGFKAATTDESLIRAWWEKYPDANIAIPTGEVSGLAVVDVDDKTGWNELKKILPSHYDWRSVPRQKTGKPDAWHLAFAYPGCHVKSGVRFVPGVDSRGDGGYIMAAPSSHKLGRRYEWKLLPANNDQLPTLPPEFLAAINRTNSNEHRERLNTAELLKGVPKGEQRVTAARLAGKFRHADLPLEAAEELILKFAVNCTPPLSDKEALSQLRGIYRRYPAASYAETSGAEPHEQTQETFWPVPMTAKEFLNRPKDTRRWIVQDVLAFESTSIIVAPARDGKTTLAINLGLSVARGLPFLDRATTAVPVFYLSIDNSASDVDELLKNLSLKESDQFSIHTGGIPLDSIGWFRDMMTRYSYKLAIIDTVQRFFELKDANDYAEATRRMGEIDCLVKELGAPVLYVHHANKSGEFLGTTAFKAMCPTYMQIRRIGEQQQRVLSSDQRNGKNFESLPISFDKYGWLKIVGTLEDVWIEEMKPKITELLEIENTGMSEAQIRQSVEGRGIIVSKAVRQLFGENEIQRTGTGRKGDPFKYFLAANLLRDPSDNPSEDCRPNGGVVGLSQGGILKAGKRFSSYLLSLGEENQEGETDKTTGRESKNTTQVNETTSENALPEVLGRAREEHGKRIRKKFSSRNSRNRQNRLRRDLKMDRFEIKKTPDGKLLARRKDGQPLTAEDREQLAGMKEQMKLDFPKTFPGRTDSKAISCDLESGEIVAVAIVSEILDAEIWLSFRDNFNPQDNRAVFFAHELPTLRTKTANQLRAIHSVKLTFPKSINKRTAA